MRMPVAPGGRRAAGMTCEAEPVSRPVSGGEPPTPWEEYRLELLRFVRNRVRDDATAEDLVHDALVRALRQHGSLKATDRLLPWLYQITRNVVTDHYRARRVTAEVPDDLPADLDDAPDVAAELAHCLAALLQGLPERYRGAVVLSEMDGLTQQETAARLGLSLSGAKSRVQRGRAKLRDLLLQCCQVEFDSRGAPVDYTQTGSCGPGSAAPPAGCSDGCFTPA